MADCEDCRIRCEYKTHKRAYKAHRAHQKAKTAPAEIVEVAPAKKERKPRAQRPRTEKELANDARMRARIVKAKEIKAANPDMKWTDAVKQAAAEMKAQ